MMTPSSRIETFIKSRETCRFTSFLPTPDDVPTIGWGSTGPDIKLGMIWTQAQCDTRFDRDIIAFGKGVLTAIGGAPTTQDQFDAMVSLAYNIGMGNFLTSSVLRYHKQGRYALAAVAFSLWTKQRVKKTGKLVVLNGLVTRRAAEAAIYKG